MKNLFRLKESKTRIKDSFLYGKREEDQHCCPTIYCRDCSFGSQSRHDIVRDTILMLVDPYQEECPEIMIDGWQLVYSVVVTRQGELPNQHPGWINVYGFKCPQCGIFWSHFPGSCYRCNKKSPS